MRLSIYPTRIEVFDEDMEHLVAIVQMNDEATVKVEILQVIGWTDWLNITDAVRHAMHMMGMHEEPSQQMSKPHGY